MANYGAVCRSNYFRVKSPAAFEDWCDTVPGLAFERTDQENMYMIYMNDGDGCGWPSWRYDDDDDEEETELDLTQELSEFLFEKQVAILEEVGSEKLRYLHGSSIAVDWRGESLSLSLTDMYRMVAEEWPDHDTPSECNY